MYSAQQCPCHKDQLVVHNLELNTSLKDSNNLTWIQFYLKFHGNINLPVNSLYLNIQTPFGIIKNIYLNESVPFWNYNHLFKGKFFFDKSKIKFEDEYFIEKKLLFYITFHFNIDVLNSSGFTMDKYENQKCVQEFLEENREEFFTYTQAYKINNTLDKFKPNELNLPDISCSWIDINYEDWQFLEKVILIASNKNKQNIYDLYFKIIYEVDDKTKVFVLDFRNEKNPAYDLFIDWDFSKNELFVNKNTSMRGIFFPFKTKGKFQMYFKSNKTHYYGSQDFYLNGSLLGTNNDIKTYYKISLLQSNKELSENEI